MDITLVYKWGFDPDDAYISSDGSFKLKRGKLVASDDDAAAAVSARAVAGATGGHITGITIGDGDAGWAAARGAGTLVVSEGYRPAANDAATAKMLCTAISAAPKADLVLIADDVERAGVAPMLAELLGLPCVLGVRDVAYDAERDALVAHRSVDGGMQTLAFRAPALVSISALTSEKVVPSMKEMLAARKAPKKQVEAVPVEGDAVIVTNTEKQALVHARLFEGTPDEAAAALVATLSADGLL